MDKPKRNGRHVFWLGTVTFVLLAAVAASLHGYDPILVIAFAVLFPVMTLVCIAVYIATADRFYGKSTDERIDDYIEINRQQKV